MQRFRILILVAVVVAVSLAHYLTPTAQHGLHALYRWFYHLPIILGAFWFGLRGGAGLAAFVTVLYLPHVFLHWGGGHAVHWLEIVLYNLVGWVTGVLSEQQRRAYDELKERTRLLLETEEQLRRADRLSVLGELSAALAHEIRTPLASIRGAAEILAGSADGAEREEFSKILVGEVDRLNRVVSDFLTFARPGEASVPADANATVLDVLRLIGAEARRRDVALTSDLADGLPAVGIPAEPLSQVVLNLVMNGIQAIEGGGAVAVSTRPAGGGGVVLTVADSGRGIPEADRARIFDPFFTTREGGTGLGLAVVRKILDARGASIEVRPGAGTVVTVRLPGGEGHG